MTDPVSDVLRTVRLTGGVFLDVRLTAPYCVISELTAADCRPLLENPAQLIFYHVLFSGRSFVTVAGEPPIIVEAGEIVILPHNDSHTLASGQGLRATHASSLVEPESGKGLARIVHGGGGAETHLVCGFLGSVEASSPVISSLPRIMKLDLRYAASRRWIESSAGFAVEELAAGRLPSSDSMSRLSELLLVEAVRQYIVEIGPQGTGWLRGLGDPRIGRALALIHGDFGRDWTAAELAREVGMSRTAFSERFASLVGHPPIRYLGRWRLHVARQHLRDGRLSISQIAHAVGYESEEAFSRAFKREIGQPPVRWRDALAAS